MSTITKPYSFGTNECFVCHKKLKKNRKWYYCCSGKCQNNMPYELNNIINNCIDHSLVGNANIYTTQKPRRVKKP